MRLVNDPNYTRLPGGSRTLLGPVQYWLAKDHLLLVEVVWLVEKYRRFDLKDLEALTVRPTWLRVWIWSAFALGITLSLALGIYLWREETETASLVVAGLLLGMALVLLGCVLWVYLLGAGCEVRLTTSVQSIVLPGLRFRKGVERFRAALVAALASMPSSPRERPILVSSPGSTSASVMPGESSVENPPPPS